LNNNGKHNNEHIEKETNCEYRGNKEKKTFQLAYMRQKARQSC
jgi:hypothetical protein